MILLSFISQCSQIYYMRSDQVTSICLNWIRHVSPQYYCLFLNRCKINFFVFINRSISMITRVVLVNRHRGWKLSSKTLLKREAAFQGGCLLYFQLMYLLNYWEHSLSWLLSTLQGGPKTHRDMHSTVTQLSGDECKKVVLVLRYSSDKALVKEKMKQHFSTERMWLKTQPQPSLSWIFFSQDS